MGELFKRDPKRYCPFWWGEEVDDDSDEIDGDNNGGGNGNGDSHTDFDKAAGGESNTSTSSSSSSKANTGKGVHISSGSAKPVLLTKLRTDALRDIFIRYNSYSPDDAQVAAEEAFEIWTQARHDAIPDHLARDVVQSLDMLRRSIRSKNGGHGVVMGAITDGNSDPRTVELLEPYFDFVVNSEDVGVAKPIRGFISPPRSSCWTIRNWRMCSLMPWEHASWRMML